MVEVARAAQALAPRGAQSFYLIFSIELLSEP